MIRKSRLISKFIKSQPCLQTIVTHILINISRRKSNQTMKFGQLIEYIVHISRSKSNQVVKFGQLIEYIMRNIFLEKSYTKFYGKASPRPFYKI